MHLFLQHTNSASAQLFDYSDLNHKCTIFALEGQILDQRSTALQALAEEIRRIQFPIQKIFLQICCNRKLQSCITLSSKNSYGGKTITKTMSV